MNRQPYKPEIKVDNKPLINRYANPVLSNDCDLKTVKEWPVLSDGHAIRKALADIWSK